MVFSYLDCPLCNKLIDHPLLRSCMAPHLVLFFLIKVTAHVIVLKAVD
jgi:hypothetical protein